MKLSESIEQMRKTFVDEDVPFTCIFDNVCHFNSFYCLNCFLQMTENTNQPAERQRIVIVPGMGCTPAGPSIKDVRVKMHFFAPSPLSGLARFSLTPPPPFLRRALWMTPVRECNWYAWLQDELEKDPTGRFTVILEDMPDPNDARESHWLPFIRNTLKIDEKTILVGHSSGSEAIMRLTEKDKVRGMILVAACHTDLGDENERASEYYNRPW